MDRDAFSPRQSQFLLTLALVLSLAGCGGAGVVTSGTAHTFAYVNQLAGALDGDPTKPLPAQISGYSVDPTTGALTPLSASPFPVPSTPATEGQPDLVATPDGHFLFRAGCTDLGAAGRVDCSITAMAVGSDGRLSVRTTQSVGGIDGMQIVRSGKFLYTFNHQVERNLVFGFQIGSDGRLTSLPQVAPPTPGAVGRIAVTASGKFLYAVIFVQFAPCSGTGVPCQNVLLMAYSINENTGALTPVAGAPFVTPLQSVGNDGSSEPLVIDGQSRFVYVAGEFGQLAGFAINGDTGALTALPVLQTGVESSTAVATLDGRFVFLGVGAIPGSFLGIAGFSIGSSGSLKPVPGSPLPIGSFTIATTGPVTLDPTGRFLYFLGAPFKSPGIIWKVSLGPEGSISSPGQQFGVSGPQALGDFVIVTRTP